MKALIPHFIHQQTLAQQWQGTISGYAMYVDLSGFTALADTLMAKGSSGAEELSQLLNDTFGPLVKAVYARGGFIPHFAGDAILAIFPGENAGLEALDMATFAMHSFHRRQPSPEGHAIGLKIGLSFGEITWGIVGKEYHTYYFRGNPIAQSALCQAKAKNPNTPVIIDTAFRLKVFGTGIGCDEIEKGYFAAALPATFNETTRPKCRLPRLHKDIVMGFLPQSLDYNQKNGEFRTVVSLFVAFEEITDPITLDRFIAFAATHIRSFSGYLKEVDFGDKGSVLVCFFGAPVSFENNGERALEFACSLREKASSLQEAAPIRLKTGITEGFAYAGIVGGKERCQYALVGTSVNLAARLMAAAQWGEILVGPSLHKSRLFHFQFRGDIQYKGMGQAIPTYCLAGRIKQHTEGFSGQMIGRAAELSQVLHFSQPLHNAQPAGLVCMFGEAGIGKTRLAAEVRYQIAARGDVGWAYCPAEQILRKPLNPFVFFLKNYFNQNTEETTTGQNLAAFEQRFRQCTEQLSTSGKPRLLEELRRTQPVLAALLGHFAPDTLWERLDARGRYENAIQAVVNLLCCEASLRPLVVHIEDAHGLDEHSCDLILALLRRAHQFPMLVMITSRFGDNGEKPPFPEKLHEKFPDLPYLEIQLNTLDKPLVRALAENHLGGKISNDLFDTLLRYSNSNPFFIEQLLEYFEEQHLLIHQTEAWTLRDPAIQLSNSIYTILTARIDRLSGLAKETVKAAAVIGREFELPVLEELMLSYKEFLHEKENARSLLEQQIATVEKGQIWKPAGALKYIFSHALLREAAYGMQVKTRLQQLHRLIAETIEKLYHDRLEDRYFDLAFHYGQAGITQKTMEYLQKAGDYALSQYENRQALMYFQKFLALQGKSANREKRFEILLKKAKILENLGEWEQCDETCQEAITLAKNIRNTLFAAQAKNAYGRLRMLKGDYFEAASLFRKALQAFEVLDQGIGTAEALGHLGNLFFRQGQYEISEQYLLRCIETARNLAQYRLDAQFVANLGLNYMNQGNYAAAISCQQEHLAFCRYNNDRQGMCVMFVHLGIVLLEKGDYAPALEHFQQGLDLSNELGNKQLTAVALGNIGEIYERQGDYRQAMDHYRKDLELCESLGDKQGIAIALGLIGQLLNIQGEFHRAIEYLQKDLMLCEEMGYLKGSAKALNTLGDIFFNLKECSRALHFYDRAIALTRQIGQPLLLGLSLAEKGAVLLETGNHTLLEATVKEALDVAAAVGNPDLTFEARILEARTHITHKRIARAKNILESLLGGQPSPDQEAAIFFELAGIDPLHREYALKARESYARLYQVTPRYLYKIRLEALAI
ncbi:MAG: tetratricopeptide repeat protein [Saprospiraceae bacterium]